MVLSTDDLSSDGILKFGFPLTVYKDFNGKGNYDELELGVKPINILITILSLFFISIMVSKVIKQQ